MTYLYNANSPQLTNRLVDLWQAETQLAYRLDEWLLRFLRDFEGVDPQAVSGVRRRYYAARAELHAHIRALGRAVARIPMVADATDDSPDAAARGLQRSHTDLTRADRRLECTDAEARRHRDFACLRALSGLHDAHHDALDLLKLLFQRGQEQSRAALRDRVA